MMFNLTLPFGKVPQASFSLESGECVLLAGPNGCGKTTLLKQMALDFPICVLIPTGIPKVKGFTLKEFITTGCFTQTNWAGKLNKEASERLEQSLKILGLSQLSGRDISTLSDGEFQKACIAVGLSRKAEVLLLDEPTSFLDAENRVMVLQTLSRIARDTGISILFSSHDLHDSLAVADRALVFTPEGLEMSGKGDGLSVVNKAFTLLL